MSQFPIKSIFEQISETVFNPTQSLVDLKQNIIIFVESKKINEKDKKMIINNIKTCQTMIRLQSYVANSLLKYEGLSLSQLNKPIQDSSNSDVL